MRRQGIAERFDGARPIADVVRTINRATDAQVQEAMARRTPFQRRSLITGMLQTCAGASWRHSDGRNDLQALMTRGLNAFQTFVLSAKRWERQRRLTPGTFPEAQPASGAPRQPHISAVVLAKNEEARLSRCLDSLRWTREVIVVDGESTDRTAAIARAHGAQVLTRPFSGSYAEERNAGAEEATGQWILQLDADEVVTERFRQAVARVFAQPPRCDAFKFQRRSVLLGRPMRYGGWVHEIPNFYRKDRVRMTGLVHERLEGAQTIERLDAPIDHYAIEALSPYLDTQNRYTTLAAHDLLKARGRLPPAEVRYHLTRKPLKVFWKSYVKKQGCREGMYGLVLGILFAWVHFLTWAKYWELQEASDGGHDAR